MEKDIFSPRKKLKERKKIEIAKNLVLGIDNTVVWTSIRHRHRYGRLRYGVERFQAASKLWLQFRCNIIHRHEGILVYLANATQTIKIIDR